jgi:hypothetical protein
MAVNHRHDVFTAEEDATNTPQRYGKPTSSAVDGIQIFMLDVWIGFHAILACDGRRDGFILLAIHPRFHLGGLTKLGIAYVSPIQELVSSSSTHA